jgi:rhodanese-related sulfurtransferase
MTGARTLIDRSTRWALLLALALGCAGGVEPDQITAEDLLARSDAPLVLDVRSGEEFASGHVPGAVNVPYDQVAARIDELGAPREVVVYCERGPRASKAAAVLSVAGFAVKHLAGHMSGWREAGLPVQR